MTMVKRYRKKPVVIEAVLFTRDTFSDVADFTDKKAHDFKIERHPGGKCTCIIPTLEGEHIASEGDYIIKGVKGEFYPCKPDIFAQTYEVADIDKDPPSPPESLVVHGRWVKHDGYTECSICEYWYDSPETEDDGDRMNYCPSCGAKMDLEE